MTRVLLASLLCPSVLLIGCGWPAQALAGGAKPAGRVLVIGMDGLDPKLLRQLMDAGRMPAFSRLAAQGSFKPLATSMPPQSPVAWANFISGSHPGKHQIYDFIHRDPSPSGANAGYAVLPDMSISKMQRVEHAWYNPAGWVKLDSIPWGKGWRIPLAAEAPHSQRRGDVFWDYLLAAGVPTAIYRVPANYPPDDGDGSDHFCCLSGMGTPDLHGTDGEFTKYDETTPLGGRHVGGGDFVRLDVRDDRAVARLVGPENFLQVPDKRDQVRSLTLQFEIVRDPQADVARIDIGGRVIVLQRGEWSEWTPVTFETGIPGGTVLSLMTLPTSVSGMVRFFLREVHPKLELYTTPVNMDPFNPANPISTPRDFAADVARKTGRYYTTGIPEDTKALRSHAIDEDQFLQQAMLLLDERVAQYRAALAGFQRGFLFFYFGSTDQLAHVFWRDRDPGHPGLKPGETEKYGRVLDDLYVQMDGLLDEAMKRLGPQDTLIVMSDHGFGSFRRGFNVNTWLVREGYMTLYDVEGIGKSEYDNFINVNWPQTRAYAIGINSLYVNLAGREKNGVVKEADRAALLREIGEKLLTVRDDDGATVIHKYYITQDVYPGADPKLAPDLLIGYASNYRGSWSTALGGMSNNLLENNDDRWSGDHCVAADLVPGVIVSNRPIAAVDPRLEDVAPSILALYGIPTPATMTGKPIFAATGNK